MTREFFDPSPDELEVVVVSAHTIHSAASFITSCEACNPDAEIPLDWVLDHVTNRLGSRTDYILAEPARCPNCGNGNTEKTLIEPTND